MDQSNTLTSATIHLSPQEELGQLIQKLIDEPAASVTIDVPARASIAQGDIAFRVLADRAAQLGKSITISTASHQTAALAARAGLKTDSPAPIVDPSAALAEPAEVAPPTTSSPQAPTSKLQSIKAWLAGHKVAVSLVAIFLAVGIGGIMMALYFLPQATITIYTQERTIDRDVQLTANPDATSVNQQDMVVPATVVSVETSQQKSFAATGKKDVGEKATGTITIFNQTTQPRTLPQGTIVKTDNVSFALNRSVTAPAATTEVAIDPDTLETINKTTPGKIDAAVTATQIGPEYNVAAKSTFSIGNFGSSSMTGRNDAAFTGGTKKNVTVVTSQDRQEALQSLTDEVEKQAIKDLQAKITSDQLLLDDAIEIKVTTADFSKATNEEAENFTLNLTMTASSPVVSKTDLNSLLSETIEGKVPEGYKLTDQEPAIETAVTEVEDDGVMQITSTFRAQIIPDIDTASLISQVKGKNPSIVEEYLKGQPNFSGYDIKLSPKLPAPFDNLPSRDSAIQIKVEIKSD